MSEHDAVPFPKILRAELDHIQDSRHKRGVEIRIPYHNDPRECARKGELLGLAFSGGGIRSATFNLGVLQGLAEHEVLQEVDYLSTVSGGGYIGAWFLSLLKENGTDEQVQQVQSMLKQDHGRHPERADQDPIHVLRQFSNYLTPRLIFYSADVWTMVASWTRNTLLNLFLLIGTIALPLLFARLLAYWFFVDEANWDPTPVSSMLSRFVPWYPPGIKFDGPALLGTLFFLLFAVVCVCGNLATKQQSPDGESPYKWKVRQWWHTVLEKVFQRWGQWQIQVFVVGSLLCAGIFLSHWMRNTPDNFAHNGGFLWSIAPPAIALWTSFLAVSMSSGLWSCFKTEHPLMSRWGRFAGGALLMILVSAIPAFVTSLLLWSAAGAFESFRYDPQFPWLLLTWGPPATLLGLSLGEIVQLGIIGRDFDEAGREWFSRLRGWTLIYSFAWIIVFGASIYGPLWMEKLWNAHPWAGAGLTTGWVATTIAGIFSAKSTKVNGKGGGEGGGSPWLDIVARVAPFVFMVGFILAIASGVHFVLAWGVYEPNIPKPGIETSQMQLTHAGEQSDIDVRMVVNNHPKTRLDLIIAEYFCILSYPGELMCLNCTRHFISAPVNLFLVLLAVVILLASRLDINVFSLHEFYKNRLVRCYLGATRWKKRKADKFTGFDERDDVHLKRFHSRDRDGRYYGPYPIINATMNISSGQNLAWQQRKSVPFIFTPRYAGYNVEKSGNEAMRLDQSSSETGAPQYAYRPTEAYCYPRGIHLGTAVAVSGAAASPNQGYHTSTAVAFLMTVFDVRLGWWVGNPRERERKLRISKTYDRATPRFNLGVMSSELFGVSSADSGYVNLSDGGHFDNMGLYELVRRRCRYIIVSDAEQDGDLTFGSMTTVIRNCRMDFGVEIKIAFDRIAKDEDGHSRTHCVVGKIDYPEDLDERDKRKRKHGYLLYIKSSLTGDEQPDVIGYHAEHPEFPHQTTADQWFTEAQFESYRRLGYHIADSALGSVREKAKDRGKFFQDLEEVWYPPSERVERFAADHSLRFTELISSIGEEDRLSFLDPQLFFNWQQREMGIWQRKARYQVGALIDFMHTVYTQLNLESKHEQEQPHNKGWMRIFKHWAQNPDFEATWKSAQNMFGPRFGDFYRGLKDYDDSES